MTTIVSSGIACEHFLKFDLQTEGRIVIISFCMPQIVLKDLTLCFMPLHKVILRWKKWHKAMRTILWKIRSTRLKLAAKWKVQKSTQTLKHHNNPIVISFGWAWTIEVIVVINLERSKEHLCRWDMCKCDFARLESWEWRASGDRRPH